MVLMVLVREEFLATGAWRCPGIGFDLERIGMSFSNSFMRCRYRSKVHCQRRPLPGLVDGLLPESGYSPGLPDNLTL